MTASPTRVQFDTRNSTYELHSDECSTVLVRVRPGNPEILVHHVDEVITEYPSGSVVRWPINEFLIGVAQDDAVHATATFLDNGGGGWTVTQIQPKPRAAVDPTAIPMHLDPRQQRFAGTTVHGGLHFDVPFITEITPGLWLGGCERGLRCPPQIDRVLSLYPWAGYTLAEHQERVEIAMYDAGLPDVTVIRDAANQVARWRDDGKAVLVHCQAGLNRSALVMATYLVKHCWYTPEQVITMLRSKRSPAVLCNQAFVEYVEGLA